MARLPRSPLGWRWTAAALCLVSLAVATTDLLAQPRGNRLLPRYVTVGPPDQAEGARILAEFRQLGLPEDYYLAFVLEVLPRRGGRRSIPGDLWGSRTAQGPVSRLEMRPAEGPLDRLLVQNGPTPRAWLWTASTPDRPAVALGPGRLLEPLAGTTATAFDLQMPFVHWPEFVFEGVTRVRGRTAHAFLLYPPERFAEAHPHVGGVRIYLDLQFHALMQAVVLDQDEEPLRTMTVLDLKKVGDQWIVKSIDLRDEETRNKTRFRVTGAALEVEFAARLFAPEALDERIAPPADVVEID